MRTAIFLLPILLFTSHEATLVAGSTHDEIRFRRFGLREGLSETTIDAIVQDHRGFLWVGTMDGLNRYDGYEFRVFVNSQLDSTTISDNWINALLVRRDGILWIGTENGGLNRYDPSTEQFARFTHQPGNPRSLPANKVFALCEDSQGILWVGTTGGGLCRWDSARGFVSVTLPAGHGEANGGESVTALLEDTHGDIWVGTSTGLIRLRRDNGNSGRSASFAGERMQKLPQDFVAAIAEDSHGDIWIGVAEHGLYKYNGTSDGFTHYTQDNHAGLSDNWVRCIHEDTRGRLWVGTWNGGLNLYDKQLPGFRRYRHEANDDETLSSDVVISMCEDRAGGIWFGTLQGISYVDSREKKFLRYHHNSFGGRSIGNDNVEDIKHDVAGGTWVATRGGGLDYLAPGSQLFTHFRTNPNDPHSISSNQVMCITCGSHGEVWAGTRDHGLNRLGRTGGGFTRFLHAPGNESGLADNGVTTLLEDRAGDLWIGTNSHGLDLMERQTGRFTHFTHSENDSVSISGNRIWSILEDSAANLWVGTWGAGLNRYDRRTGRFTRFIHDPADSTSIADNSIYSLLEESPGILWIGTAGGLSRYDMRSGRFSSFDERDGLPDKNVCSMLADGHGSLWLGTNRGLSRFDPRTLTFRTFTRSDGIQTDEFQQGAASLRPDGWMFFGGVGGVTAFHPDSIRENSYVPPVVLTRFRVLERPMRLPGGDSRQTAVELHHDQNFFSFEFAALSFTAPEKNRYLYMLEGFDQDWISCGTRRYAAYTNLDAGKYVFRARGSNNDGVWNRDGTAVAISIVPPYWRTWWFYALVALAVGSLGTGLVQRRIAFLKRQARAQQEMSRRLLESQENERKRIGASLHDSLGQNLIIIKNLAAMAVDEIRSQKPVEPHVSQISTLASQALAEVREIAYDLRPYQLDRLGLTGALRSIAERMAATTQVKVTVDLDDVDGLVRKDQEISLFRIIQESINNILKHSHATDAAIEGRRNDDAVVFSVRDNGVGFDVQQGGFGISGMNERARILGASLAIESGRNAGTCVRVTVPLKGNDR